MAMQPREMAMQPREPDTNPLANMPPEAVEALMQPDDDIQAVLVARLSNMAPQELQMLDAAVTPEVAAVLVRLLPAQTHGDYAPDRRHKHSSTD